MSATHAQIALAPFAARHLAVLARWLREPHVAPWYAHPEDDLAWAASPPVGGAQAIVATGENEIGYLRWRRVDREVLDALGLDEIPAGSVDADILISAEGVGVGAGPAALRALIDLLRRDASVPLIGLTTEIQNHRAHRAFERAGFRIVRQYDDGVHGMCHLMTLDLRAARGR
jgi:aminoglycoside 6'-N-acetyltransferase